MSGTPFLSTALICLTLVPSRNRTKTYHRMFVDFGARELKISGLSRLPISEDDVGYVFEELNRGRSIVAPNFAVPSRPTLCRWRKDGGHSLDNLVVFDRDQANRCVSNRSVGAGRHVASDPSSLLPRQARERVPNW